MTEPRSPKRWPLLRLGLGLCTLAALALMFGCSPEKAAPEPGDPPRMEEPLPAVSPDTLPEKEPEEALSPDGLPLVIPLRANEEAPTALEEGDPAAAVVSWYFAATPQGAEFLFDVGSSQEAQVADLDGDGQGEAWEYYNHGEAGWSFYDRDAEGRLWRYFLPAGPGAPLDEAESEKGLVPAGMEGNALLEEDGNPLGPYLLKDGALHLQEEREP